MPHPVGDIEMNGVSGVDMPFDHLDEIGLSIGSFGVSGQFDGDWRTREDETGHRYVIAGPL